MIKNVKSISTKAMIVPPELEQKSWQDEVEIWKGDKGGIAKTKKMIELCMDGSLETDQYFLSIKDMCINGKIFHPESVTKFQEHLLKEDIIDIASTWLDDCLETITYICNNNKYTYKILKEGVAKGNFLFKVETNGVRYQFANILNILGLATLDIGKKRIKCYLTNKGNCNGVQIFKNILSKNEAYISTITPPKLIEDGTLSDEMVTVDASTHLSLISFSKQSSDNKITTGDSSPIGNKNKIKKKIIKNNSKNKKGNWFIDKLLPILLTLLIPLTVGVFWLLITGHSLQDISKTFDSKAGLQETITPSISTTPIITN